MSSKVFINLPVKDLKRSKDFFQALGYSFNQQFSDDTAASLVISDTIYAMLLTEEKFKGFLPNGKQLSDANTSTEVLIALSFDSKEEVDRMADTAISAGGTEARPPEDHGFMYGRSFQDPDGHIWEVFWMDPSFVQPQQ